MGFSAKNCVSHHMNHCRAHYLLSTHRCRKIINVFLCVLLKSQISTWQHLSGQVKRKGRPSASTALCELEAQETRSRGLLYRFLVEL